MTNAWAKAKFTPDNRPGEKLRPYYSVEEHRRFADEHGDLVEGAFTETEFFEILVEVWDQLMHRNLRGDDIMRCYTITAWALRRTIRTAAERAGHDAT